MKIVLAIDPGQPLAAYRDALVLAGARPEEVGVVRPGDELPEAFDGLFLSGGADVEPSLYGEEPLNETVLTIPARDALELELFARAERLGVPVFGVCRGMQVVNVALGGTLWQDLPAQRPGSIRHSPPKEEPRDPARPAHPVRIAPDLAPSLPFAAALARLDGGVVNSRHHQAVRELAPGLVALATSPDGVVEALARPEEPFLAAVQWHPENLVAREEQLALFVEFVAAARRSAGELRSPRPPDPDPPAAPVPSPRDTAGGHDGQNDAPPRAVSGGALVAPPGPDRAGAPEPE